MIAEYGLSLSLFCGISRKHHGSYFYRQLKPRTYETFQVKPGDVKALPFWSRLKNRRVLTIDVSDTNPVPGLDGIQISDLATHHGSICVPQIQPPGAEKSICKIFGPQLKIPFQPNPKVEAVIANVRKLNQRVEKKGRLLRMLLEEGNVDFVSAFFSETDAGSHYCWKYRADAIGVDKPVDVPELIGGILGLYQAIDREMGQAIELIGKDANVMIISLYGMRDEYLTSTLSEYFCRQLGYHVLLDQEATDQSAGTASSSAKKKKFYPISLARMIMPESLRTAISHHLPRSTQEKLLGSSLRDGTNWSCTTAFAIPSISTGFIRVNLQDREPQGIVKSGSEYQELLSRIEADFALLTDPKTGKPAVRRTARAVDLFGAGPPELLPDLFVEWKPGPRFLDRVKHPKTELVQPKPSHFFDSQEKLQGFFAAAGPDIQGQGDLGEVAVPDMAPTWLQRFGESPSADMTGEIISRMIEGSNVNA
ncbi:MAG: hypothetical protein P8N76_25965 [Pirellulaceae bacterium]|nr:hypothetical protein [Pirellulaceae bacterium]